MVKWVVVDELHLVSVWDEEFRKSYAMLEVIRHTLGHKPWFGCTATLDNSIWQKGCLSTDMKESTYTIKTPIDRPEVALIRHVVRKADKIHSSHFILLLLMHRDGKMGLGWWFPRSSSF